MHLRVVRHSRPACSLALTDRIVGASPKLEALVRDVVRQKGSFLGISTKPMRCADFSLGKDSVFVFVHKRRADVTLMGATLRMGKRHVLVVGTSLGKPLGTFIRRRAGNWASLLTWSVGCVYAAASAPSPPPATRVGGGVEKAGMRVGEAPACFPAEARVEVAGRGVVRMDQVAVGDFVRVGGNEFARVFMFTHRDGGTHDFVRLEMEGGVELVLSAGHYVYIDSKMMAAREARVGSTVELTNGSLAHISSVGRVRRDGLYNPHTTHGDILVNDVRVSTYTETVPSKVAHALLAPMRAIYAALGMTITVMDKGALSFIALIIAA